MVAPLDIARGTQNKILEAMAMGVPVVTSRVAAGGVDARSRRAFPGRVDARRSTPRRSCAIIDDPAERERLAAAGRERMLSHHAWDDSMQRLDAIIERCLAASPGARAADRLMPHDNEKTRT